MLYTPLTHPPLLEALSRAGHGAKVLIADANYPFSTAAGANSTSVYLNFRRNWSGGLTVNPFDNLGETQIVRALPAAKI